MFVVEPIRMMDMLNYESLDSRRDYFVRRVCEKNKLPALNWLQITTHTTSPNPMPSLRHNFQLNNMKIRRKIAKKSRNFRYGNFSVNWSERGSWNLIWFLPRPLQSCHSQSLEVRVAFWKCKNALLSSKARRKEPLISDSPHGNAFLTPLDNSDAAASS